MNKLKFSDEFGNYEVYFDFQEYASNGATLVLALLSAIDPYGNVSVNIEHAPILPKGQFYLKDWSGHGPIAKAMIDEKLIEPVAGTTPAYSGFIVAHAYQFTEDGLKDVENAVEFLQHTPKREDIQMYIDDWPTQATRSLWYMMQDEEPQTLKKVLGNDQPTLAEATERFRTWIKEKRIRVPNYTDPKLLLEREMIDCALDEVDWKVITFRIAIALEIPICEITSFLFCPKCYGSICQLCMLCMNPKCEKGHERGCISEAVVYPLGPILFDFTDRKLVLRIGEYELPISHKEYKRFYTWLDIRKNG